MPESVRNVSTRARRSLSRDKRFYRQRRKARRPREACRAQETFRRARKRNFSVPCAAKSFNSARRKARKWRDTLRTWRRRTRLWTVRPSAVFHAPRTFLAARAAPPKVTSVSALSSGACPPPPWKTADRSIIWTKGYSVRKVAPYSLFYMRLCPLRVRLSAYKRINPCNLSTCLEFLLSLRPSKQRSGAFRRCKMEAPPAPPSPVFVNLLALASPFACFQPSY